MCIDAWREGDVLCRVVCVVVVLLFAFMYVYYIRPCSSMIYIANTLFILSDTYILLVCFMVPASVVACVYAMYVWWCCVLCLLVLVCVSVSVVRNLRNPLHDGPPAGICMLLLRFPPPFFSSSPSSSSSSFFLSSFLLLFIIYFFFLFSLFLFIFLFIFVFFFFFFCLSRSYLQMTDSQIHWVSACQQHHDHSLLPYRCECVYCNTSARKKIKAKEEKDKQARKEKRRRRRDVEKALWVVCFLCYNMVVSYSVCLFPLWLLPDSKSS